MWSSLWSSVVHVRPSQISKSFLATLNHSWPTSGPEHGGGLPRVTLASASTMKTSKVLSILAKHFTNSRTDIMLFSTSHYNLSLKHHLFWFKLLRCPQMSDLCPEDAGEQLTPVLSLLCWWLLNIWKRSNRRCLCQAWATILKQGVGGWGRTFLLLLP